jgi:ABC-2 type transport system permease protein
MRLLSRELTKIFFQKRTFVGWAALLVVPIIMVIALDLSSAKPQAGEGPPFLSQALSNGLLIPVSALAALSFFLLPLVAAMAGGHQLAGEAEQGTIKTWLVHPVSRGAVLLSKWGVAVIYVLVGIVLVIVGGLVAGGIAFGIHPLVLLSGTTVSVTHGLGLVALTAAYLLLATVCVLSLAMLVSTFSNSSLTAAIVALVVVVVMQILGNLSYFDFLKPYLFTNYLEDWQNFFRQPIDWPPVQKGLLTFAIYIVAATVAAWLVFRRKDVLV